ncbi:putative ribonuclease H-like domain-containing protein [Tanacetum coccineum]|uniref:Ribonuclease H-like domain-containing protein n=1 Tax=Tanacetum coccineum TaxID=301880 RepID=A0ABQ4YW15_9ASTR
MNRRRSLIYDAMEMEHYIEDIDNVEKHMRRFHGMDDAKEIWEAIRTRFGGNANSKKMQKAVFKQQFEAFKISNSEGLEKGYDRFQQLLSQLEAHGAEVSTEDANHKFLRSLPSAWSNLAMTMRTNPEIDNLSIDDLYNNLRVFEQEIQGASKTSSSAQNVAFVSQSKSSTNKVKSGFTGAYSTCTPSTSSTNAPEKEVLAGFADEVIYSLFAKQTEDLDLLHEDLEQIDDVDIEEMDINWQIAMIAIRMKKFYKKTGRRVRVDGKTPVGFDKKKLECFNCHNTGHFARECTAKGVHDGKKKRDSVYQHQEAGKQEKNQMGLLTMDDGIVNWGEHTEAEETNHALMAISSSNEVSLCSKTCIDSYNKLKLLYDEQMNQLGDQEAQILAYSQAVKKLEAQLVTSQKQQLSLNEKLAFQANEIHEKDEKLKRYRRIGMKAVKEKEQLQKIVDSWKDSSKNLWRLINSGMSSNDKLGLGSVQLNAGRPKFNTVRPNINTGRTNINSGRPKVNAVSPKVNTVRSKQPVTHKTSNSSSPKRPQMNQMNQRWDFSKSYSSVRRPFANSTAQMANSNAVMGSWGSAVKTSASYNWRTSRPNFNYSSGPTFIRTVNANGNKDQLEDFEEFNGGSVTFGGSKGYISGKGRIRVGAKILFKRFPRHYNMYSFEHEVHILYKSFACLIAKRATSADLNYGNRRNQANPHAGDSESKLTVQLLGFLIEKMNQGILPQILRKRCPLLGLFRDNIWIQAFRRELEEIALKHLGTVPENNTTSPSSVNTSSHTVNTGGMKLDFNSLPIEIEVNPTPTLRIHSIHPKSQILGDPKSAVQTMSKVQNKSGAHALLNHIKADKENNQKINSIKFDLVSVKAAITPMETKLPLTKDEEAFDVDVHLYRSMIGSLMYLTASRPDIMYAVCVCSRFQVTPKTSHLNAVKRIFKYLKGKPNLGLWYPRESPFDLEAFSDSDYGGSNLDRKSTTGGCQFLGQRLISWQCKKQTIVATSTTEAEYVAAANCCGQVLWVQNQLLDYGFNFMNTKIHIDNESTICIVKNPVYHSKTKHIEIRHHFIRDCYEKKLISVEKIHTDLNVADLLTKPFDGPRFNYLVVSIGIAWMKGRSDRGFAEIVDFLRGSNLRYALTSNPTIYDSLVKQFWQTAIANTKPDGSLEINATIDTIGYTITEASIRDSLRLEDATGITMLPNDELFEGMGQMGYPTDGTFTFWKSFFTP